MARPEAPGGTVSQAVREHLRQLCLREFPCGTGSWNESRFLPQTWRTWRELVPREEEAAKAGEETEEALLGLVRSPHSPWARLGELSAQDSFLRELAIRNPLMLKDTFFYSYFKSLRVVNKAVSLVDRDLLKFKKLEELVLSANRIKEVDAANLPPTLKVLELYGNEVTSMACLCAQPPPGLQHLGLGHNKLQGPMESQHVTTSHWPGLVSLDLGFNNLLDLQGMVGSLRSLRQLRLLVLQGNPLALVPYYRGFTIDSLARLCVLDDITVSPHEKHQFRGLGLSGDLLPREAQLVVTIGNVTGVLDSSVLDPEPGPEGPFITYSYYVTYDFVEDEEGEGNEYGGVLAQIVKPSSPSTEMPPEEGSEEAGESLLESPLPESGELEESVASAGPAVLPSDSAEELAKLRPRIDPRLCPSPGTVLFSTLRKPWADVISCSYEMQHTLRDLGPLKAFLLAGTTVTVVEEKILSWPVLSPDVESSAKGKGGQEGQEGREGRRERKTRKRDDGKDKARERKAPKKKKEAPGELRQDPPVLQVLGHGQVVLEPLLAGSPWWATVCNFGVVRTPESDRLTSAGYRAPPSPPPHGAHAKTKKTPKKAAVEDACEPAPLTVEVQVQLSQCRSAEEALRAFGGHAPRAH
nr:LOW QUALITY PROTEIN: leucine-rich repeat-containing protein 43 [Dasypus novemcinctus]